MGGNETEAKTLSTMCCTVDPTYIQSQLVSNICSIADDWDSKTSLVKLSVTEHSDTTSCVQPVTNDHSMCWSPSVVYDEFVPSVKSEVTDISVHQCENSFNQPSVDAECEVNVDVELNVINQSPTVPVCVGTTLSQNPGCQPIKVHDLEHNRLLLKVINCPG